MQIRLCHVHETLYKFLAGFGRMLMTFGIVASIFLCLRKITKRPSIVNYRRKFTNRFLIDFGGAQQGDCNLKIVYRGNDHREDASHFKENLLIKIFSWLTGICSNLRISGDVIPDDIIAILRFSKKWPHWGTKLHY